MYVYIPLPAQARQSHLVTFRCKYMYMYYTFSRQYVDHTRGNTSADDQLSKFHCSQWCHLIIYKKNQIKVDTLNIVIFTKLC